MYKCYICFENAPKLNKICVCKESLLCDECLDEINRDNNKIQKKCAICKRKLKLKKIKDIEYYINIFRYLSYNLLLLISNTFTPTFILLNELNIIHYENSLEISSFLKIFIYIVTILGVLSIKEASIMLMINFLRVRNNLFDVFYFRYNMLNAIINIIMGLLIIFGIPDNMIVFYYLINIILVNLIPFIFICMIEKVNRIINIFKIIEKQNINMKLKILNTIDNIIENEVYNI
jgi:hypothetical protein